MEELTPEEVAVVENPAPAEEAVVEVIAEPEVTVEEPAPAAEEPASSTKKRKANVEEVAEVIEETPAAVASPAVANPARISTINGLHISIK